MTAVAVAVAAIVNERDEYLLTRRGAHQHQGGMWEFPGGKYLPGEDLGACLCRELREELDITPLAWQPLIRLRHDYPDLSVVLDVVEVSCFSGEPRSMEGQPLRWVPSSRLGELEFPAANRGILRALSLPDRYLITPADLGPDLLLQGLESSLEASGIQLVQLRAPHLDESTFKALARRALRVCHRSGARLLLNAEPALARELGADGVHLNGHRLRAMSNQGAIVRPEDFLVAASVHDEASMRLASAIDCDFVVLSPVQHTLTHPDAHVLGWDGFSRLATLANRPVYALGGMSPEHIELARAHGAQGIAAIRSLWSAGRDSGRPCPGDWQEPVV